jgi:RNA 3'-terminal phosphate cyclase (ATP)
MGVEIRFHRFRAGFYPHGGGTVVVEGALRGPIAPLRLEAAPVLSDVVLISVVSNRLPSHIGPRQLKGCREALLAGAPGLSVSREIDERPPSGGPGTSVIAVARGEHIFAGFSAIGERGKPAEKVGATAGAELAEFVKTRAHLDHYLSDQILIYAALAENQSTWTTSRITEHFRTNTYVIQRFLPVEVTLSEEERERWRVWVTPRRSASSNIPAWEMPKGGRKNG